MSGLWCPEEVWLAEDEVTIRCSYYCDKPLKKCIEDFCVEGAEIVEARGKLKVKDNCVKVIPGKGWGELKLKPLSEEVKVNGMIIKVKRLRVSPVVDEAWLGVPTPVELRFEGHPGSVEFSGFIYGNPVKGKSEVPGSYEVVVTPFAPGGFIELESYPYTKITLDLPPPKPPIKHVELVGEPFLGLPISFKVVGKPLQEFKVIAYGSEGLGKTNELGEGEASVIVNEVTEKAKVIMGKYEKAIDVPKPKEPFSIISSSIEGRRVMIELHSHVQAKARVTVEGIAKGEAEVELVKGSNVIEVPLTDLPPFSKKDKLVVTVRVGTFSKSIEVEGEVPGVARVVIFDGKRLWVWADEPTSLGSFHLKEGVNVVEAPVKGLREVLALPFHPVGDVDEVIALSDDKCVKVFEGKEMIGSVCLDEKINAISVYERKVLAIGKNSSVLLIDPTKPASVIKAGGKVGLLGEECALICSDKCYCYALSGEKAWELPTSADKLEEYFLLKDGIVYMIEGKGVRPVAEAEDFSAYRGELAILKDGKVRIGEREFEVEGNEIALGEEFLATYGNGYLSLYDLEGNLKYRKRAEVVKAKWVGGRLFVIESDKVALYEVERETFERPLLTAEELPEELRNDRAYAFITKHHEKVMAYKDCLFRKDVPFLLPEALALCKLLTLQPEYERVLKDFYLMDELPSFNKYLMLAPKEFDGGLVGEIARRAVERALPLIDLKLYDVVAEAKEVLKEPNPSIRRISEVIREMERLLEEMPEREYEAAALSEETFLESKLGRKIFMKFVKAEGLSEIVELLERYGREGLIDKLSKELKDPDHLRDEAERLLSDLKKVRKALVESR